MNNISQQKYYNKNKDKILAKRRTYYQTHREKELARTKISSRKWFDEHIETTNYMNLSPEQRFKQRIRQVVRYALKTKKISKPDFCCVCNKKCRIDAHHEDYSKPLDIMWVCRACHAEIHRRYDWRTNQRKAEVHNLNITGREYKKSCNGGKRHIYIDSKGNKSKNCLICGKRKGFTNEEQRAYYHRKKLNNRK